MASIGAKTRDLASRTVHIKMHPTARNLSERREVLRVLERFGEVTMFRSYKYHPKQPIPNAFLSIFSTASAAKEATNTSPIRYRLISTPSAPAPAPSTSTKRTSSNQDQNEAHQQAPPEPQPQEKVFELHVSPSNFNHELHLSSPISSPLHGPYIPTPPKKSFIGSILSHSIPPTIAAPGLRDWETDVRIWRNDAGVSVEGKGGGANGDREESRNGDEARSYTLVERERRRRERAVPSIMNGIKKWKEEAEGRLQEGADTAK